MKPASIRITEVGPRDGLQNEQETIPTEAKIHFINQLSESGVAEIEVSSFVSPKWVPQLADSEEVCKKIQRNKNVTYSALVPNEKGLERALQCNLKKIAVFTAASESFTKKNINATIDESIARFIPVLKRAKEEKLFVRGYISTAFYCPFEGAIQPSKTAAVIKKLVDIGVDEISIGDTIGKAAPNDVRKLLDVACAVVDRSRIVLHFHDTYGMAIANALTSWKEYGIFRFDASAGGIGGCPYAPGASGNVATEGLCYALIREGATLSVDFPSLMRAITYIASYLRHPLSSNLYRVMKK